MNTAWKIVLVQDIIDGEITSSDFNIMKVSFDDEDIIERDVNEQSYEDLVKKYTTVKKLKVIEQYDVDMNVVAPKTATSIKVMNEVFYNVGEVTYEIPGYKGLYVFEDDKSFKSFLHECTDGIFKIIGTNLDTANKFNAFSLVDKLGKPKT